MTKQQPTFGADTIANLTAGLANLGPSDRKFASDLIASADRARASGYALTGKQAHWLAVMADRATRQAAAPAARPVIADPQGILDLFAVAGRSLKRPAVILRSPWGDGVEIRLSLAGAASKEPGSVVIKEAGGGYDALYFGRISRNGGLTMARSLDAPSQAALLAAMVAFAAEPARVAAEYGKLTGRCCFCARHLDDERSTAVGYGPVCAKNFGLEWGTAKQNAALVAA